MNPDRIKIFSGNANRPLAQEICDCLGLALSQAQVKAFSDGRFPIDESGYRYPWPLV